MSLDDRIRELHASGISRTKAAELIGVTRDRFRMMLKALGLDWPKRARAGQVTLDGITDTWQAHADRLGTTVGSLRWKQVVKAAGAHKNRPISDAELQKFLELRATMPAYTAAATLGRSYTQLHAKAKERLPGYLTEIKNLPDFRRRFSIHPSPEFLSAKEEPGDEAA